METTDFTYLLVLQLKTQTERVGFKKKRCLEVTLWDDTQFLGAKVFVQCKEDISVAVFFNSHTKSE